MSDNGEQMTLQELISQLLEAYDDLAEADTELTVYARKPWTADSDAIAVSDYTTWPDAQGRTYLLEVFLIHDVLETWIAHHADARPTPQQACNAVIYYAEHDAYLIPNEDPA
jgi:hypothetical protein